MILLIMNLLMKIKPINFSIHNQVNLELLEINNKYYNYSRIHVKKEIAITVLEAFQLLEEMSRSHKNLVDIIAFGRICITKAAVHMVQLPISRYGQHHGQHA